VSPHIEPVMIKEMETQKVIKRSVPWRIRSGERRILLLVGDAVVAGLALLAGIYFWAARDDWLNFSTEFLRVRVPTWFFLIPLIWIILLVELYDVRRANRRADTIKGVAMAALAGLGIYLVVFFVSKEGSLPRTGVAVFIIAASTLTLIWRLVFISIFTAPQFMRRVLIVGAGKSGTTLLNVLNETWPPPFFLVGLIDDDPEKKGLIIEKYPVLGGGDDLVEIIQRESISDLIFAISGEMNGTMFQSMLDAQEYGVEVTTMPVVYEELLNRVPISLLESDWILRSFVDQARTSTLYETGKRLMDILGGLIGLAALVLFTPFITLAILVDSGFPIFFTQYRMGRRGQLYKIYKFRTMRQDSEHDGLVRVTTENDERITRAGNFMRKSHLDELPQVINVLVGDMSLVGPRAERSELVHNLQRKIPFYRARLLVKPGITGWAQVNFGYAATVEDTAVKLEYDLYYIKHRSLLMDIIILLRTVGTVIGLRGT